MRILIASRNPYKVAEIRAILDDPALPFEWASALDYPDIPEPVEDGDTLEANAIKKAVYWRDITGGWALADDSGVEVDALHGAPGVISAIYAGPERDAAANNAKLLAELGDRPDRRARFRCVMALAGPGFPPQTVEGRCDGVIGHAPRGACGFGYDPIFIPDGYSRTYAELSPEEKNRISHRGRALAAARAAWGDLLRQAALNRDRHPPFTETG